MIEQPPRTSHATKAEWNRKFSYIRHKLRDEFNTWGANTTFHGIPIIFRAPNWPLKLFWTLLFLASAGLCCFMLANNFAEYFEHGVTTVIRTAPNRTIRFPLITVCTTDFFPTKKADPYIINHFKENYNVSVRNIDDLIELFPNDTIGKLKWLEATSFLTGLGNKTFADSVGPTPEEFFYKIQIGDKILPLDDTTVETYIDPTFGNCFRINSKPGKNPAFDVTNVNTGLLVEIYLDEPTSFGSSDMVGFATEIRPHNGYPYVFSTYRIDLGTHNDFNLSPQYSKILFTPSLMCVSSYDSYKSPLMTIINNMGMTYTREICLDVYSQSLIVNDFGCNSHILPQIPGYPICNYSIMKANDLDKYQYVKNSNVCPIECESFQYDFEISTAEYPTRNQAKLMMASLADELNANQTKTRIPTNLSYEKIKERFASFHVRFDSLSIDEKIEEPAVPFMQFIANIGGTVGLFLSVSFLTIMEILEYGLFTGLIFKNVFIRKIMP